VWTDIIAWLHFGLIEAEELGVTTANVRRDGEILERPGDPAAC
jgi:hypothetical protein